MSAEAPKKKEITPEEKEERKLKRLALSADALEKLVAERAALDRKIARVKSIMSEQERKEDTQVKIWIGAFYTRFYSGHPERLEKFEPTFLEFIGGGKKQEVYERWKKKHLTTTDTPSPEVERS